MNLFNLSLAETILDKCKELSLDRQVSKTDGRFLADKSYAFDTMFFVSRYIQYFRFGDKFIRKHRGRENEYIADLFNLNRGTAQIPNYFNKALSLLRFAGAVEKDGNNYRILDDEIIDIFASSFENAYIFLYLMTYSVLNKHGLWDYFVEFCKETDIYGKQRIYDAFRAKYIIADKRVKDPAKYWGMFTPKYPMVVLGFANRQNIITRTGKVQNRTIETKDISLNTSGTRNNASLPKKNSYLDELSLSYIAKILRPYLVIAPPSGPVTYSASLSVDIADTKLRMIAERFNLPVHQKVHGDKYRYTNGGKVRTVQGEFRGGLLRKTPHECPVCGFSYEDFLVASHIKPYAQCEDTYDAMNPHNGLLLCPVCDKLFESANHMTIDYATGEVILADSVRNEKDFHHLAGRTIRFDYINCERRHYLRWHNSRFHEKHAPEDKDNHSNQEPD